MCKYEATENMYFYENIDALYIYIYIYIYTVRLLL